MLRKILLNIHMYGGLLVGAYLILLGVSSLQFSHHFLPDPPPPTTWERDLPPTPAGTALQPDAVRDALGLFGWINNASLRRATDGTLNFRIDRPGKGYMITASPAGHVKVDEVRRAWFLMNALHGLKRVPGSRLLTVWGVYTEIATIFGLFAAVSGVYLFSSTRRDRRSAWAILGTCTTLSVAFMAYVRYHG